MTTEETTRYEKKKKEALRYLGFGRNKADENTSSMLDRAFSMLEEVVSKKYVYRIFDLKHGDDGSLHILSASIQSKSLGKNLKGCEKIIFFGATLGPGPDRLMRRYGLTDMAFCVTLQAASAAMLEEYCDDICDRIAEELAVEELYMRPRFSPGYGDFPIQFQKDLTVMLDTPRKIGLTITDSCMMSPTKSVTAVIGVSSTKENCHRQGCEVCAKTDCAFRRDTA